MSIEHLLTVPCLAYRMLSGVKELYVYNFVNERFEIREEIEMTHMTKVYNERGFNKMV